MWVRDTPSIFAYPTVLAFHTFSLLLLVGLSTGVALRLLGVARSVPLTSLEPYFRLMWVGFWVSVVSGIVLLATDTLNFLGRPVFSLKMAAIVVAVVSMRRVGAALASNRAAALESGEGRRLAWTVLLSWMTAMTCGRVTAYDAFIQRQTAVAVVLLIVVLSVVGFVGVRPLLRGLSVDHAPQGRRSTTR
ncbi:MAG: hypothetical protein AB7I50_20530 [Vicinamibacterales bacterium]